MHGSRVGALQQRRKYRARILPGERLRLVVLRARPKLRRRLPERRPRDDQPLALEGQKVFVYYNGPTDQLSGVSAGSCVLDPGMSPHPVHQHPEEEFLIVGEGTGEIACDGKVTQVGPGAMMYCAGNTWHGITNTGQVPMTFYWSKWLAKCFRA
jgi:mannose-6-phosphate isomerase-like protein (cupin superfamily)